MKVLFQTVLISILQVLFSNSFAQTLLLENYRWTTIEAKGDVVGRHENAFIEFKGKFYLIGGRGVNPVNVFDPITNRWETKKPTPLELHHFQGIVYHDAIYIIGAMTGGYPKEKPVEQIWIYYPGDDKWEAGPVIPPNRRRGSSGAVLYENKFYIICGIDYGHTSGTNNLFDCYDPETGTWETLTKAPNLRDHFSAIVVDDKLYCIGGRNSSIHNPGNFEAFFYATNPFVDVYDFKTAAWQTLKNQLPFPTAAGGIISLNNCILYMGGEGSQLQAYNLTQCLDIKSGEWKQLSPINTGRHGSNAILYKNNIYFAAGSGNRGGGNMNSIEVFSADNSWVPMFNGVNLDGWEVKCTEADRGKDFWKVDHGTILCNSLSSESHNYIWLQSVNEYSDFELRLKFQVSRANKGNSGVQFRSRYDMDAVVEQGVAGWMDGPQADIDPANPWRNGLIYDETRETKRWINPNLTDWRISQNENSSGKGIFYYEDEETGWNDMTIICKGTNVKVIVNNVLVSDYNGSGILDDLIHLRCNVGMKGHIALQLHKNSSNFIRYKNIEIRNL